MSNFLDWLLSKMRLVDDNTEEPEEEPEEIERIYYKDIRTYEDCKVLIDNYKDGAVCILSLDPAQIADVQGMMNYACGGVYALDGVVEKVGENVFMTVPRKEEG